MMMSLLLTLDARRIIRYHRSRTNREYLWPMKKHPILYAVANEFVHNFEEMKYGRRVPDKDGTTYMFDLFRQAKAVIPEIEKEETNVAAQTDGTNTEQPRCASHCECGYAD